MTKILFDCSSGVSADMSVGALIGLGVNEEKLISELSKLDINGYTIEISHIKKGIYNAVDFNVILDDDNHDHDMEYLHGDKEIPHGADNHQHRTFAKIKDIITSSDLNENTKHIALNIFTVLAKAEAKAHKVNIEDVHFHEVGAIDSIIDITAAAICLDTLGVTDCYVQNINDGKGTVRCQHGVLNIPVPAVKNIVKDNNLTLNIIDVQGELVTPTGAAIMASIKTCNDLPKHFDILKTSFGNGKRKYATEGVLKAYIIQ